MPVSAATPASIARERRLPQRLVLQHRDLEFQDFRRFAPAARPPASELGDGRRDRRLQCRALLLGRCRAPRRMRRVEQTRQRPGGDAGRGGAPTQPEASSAVIVEKSRSTSPTSAAMAPQRPRPRRGSGGIEFRGAFTAITLTMLLASIHGPCVGSRARSWTRIVFASLVSFTAGRACSPVS